MLVAADKPKRARRIARDVARGQRNIDWIESTCRIPEGKFVGKPVVLRGWQRDIVRGLYGTPTRRGIVSFGRKNAKALALDTPIPTPDGWRELRDIHAGDCVYGSDGEPRRVLAESDVFEGKPCYLVSFSDGSHIVASADHLWQTEHSYRPWANARVNGSGNGGRWRVGVLTTEQIAGSVLRTRTDGGRESNHKLRCAAQLNSSARVVPVEPYVLGCWLGDGTSSCGSFTAGLRDVDHFQRELSAGLGGEVARTVYVTRATTLRTPGLGLQTALRALGVLNNKHIPDAYLAAGTEQRWALLQGLMDTDGTVTRCGGQTTARASFTGVNQRLCFGVWRLARSLGLKARVRESVAKIGPRVIGPKWEVTFAAHRGEPVFRLPRKQDLLPDVLGKRSRTVTIESCELVASVPTKCLMVDAPDKLFLAGYGCIPTHNTTLSAFLLLLHLCGPEARQNSQLVSAAQSVEQAGVLFSLAAKIVRMSPDLSQYVGIRDTIKQLHCSELGTLYRALSAEASTAHGLSPVFAVHDELGQVRGPRSLLYEAIETAAGAHDNPLSVIISTQAPTDADLLSVLIDDAKSGADPTIKLFMYSAPLELDPFSDEAIRAANPAFGDFLNADETRKSAEAARRMPSSESSYRNLILNQRVSQTSPFIPQRIWAACAGAPDEDVLRAGPVFVGLDLSARNDLTALVMVAQDGDGRWHVRCEFFAPETGLNDRALRDRAAYDVWASRGILTATPGASVDYDVVAERLGEICADYPVQMIAFDRWRMDVFTAALGRLGLELPLQEFGQGFKDMSPALDTLEAELLNERVRHGNNPILKWCAANAIAVKDPAGNRKLDKAKSTGRIDGLVALAMALGIATAQGPAEVSFWERAA